MDVTPVADPRPSTAAKAASRPARPKDMRIESLRGLALILMVAGHVIGDSPESGMKVADDSGYRYFYFSLSYLRMPLFTAISGFVYSLAPASRDAAGRFVVGKARRILLPFATVLTAQFLMRMATPGVNMRPSLSDLPAAYLYGIDQFWFLQSIFAIFLVVGALDCVGGLRTFPRWAAALLFSLALYRLPIPVPHVFSLNGAVWLLPFFLLGCGVKRFPEKLFHPATLAFAAACLAVGIAAQQAAWFSWLSVSEIRAWMVPALVGLTGNLLLFRYFPVVPALAFVGAHAYTAYLLHVFFTAGSRIALYRAGIDYHPIIFVVGVAAGVGMPILVEPLIAKSRLLRRAVLGLR
ncbi:acyltransferase [Paludisphaera sp.]|uniref:acyltransferase family protein n=1 Tax=Paludisphaera sp. TaxID=2017432 RepID=UPI00301CA4A7